MVDHVEGDGGAVVCDDQFDRLRTLGMDYGIFQQIDENLFNEKRVHGDHKYLIRGRDADRGVRQTLL